MQKGPSSPPASSSSQSHSSGLSNQTGYRISSQYLSAFRVFFSSHEQKYRMTSPVGDVVVGGYVSGEDVEGEYVMGDVVGTWRSDHARNTDGRIERGTKTKG